MINSKISRLADSVQPTDGNTCSSQRRQQQYWHQRHVATLDRGIKLFSNWSGDETPPLQVEYVTVPEKLRRLQSLVSAHWGVPAGTNQMLRCIGDAARAEKKRAKVAAESFHSTNSAYVGFEMLGAINDLALAVVCLEAALCWADFSLVAILPKKSSHKRAKTPSATLAVLNPAAP